MSSSRVCECAGWEQERRYIFEMRRDLRVALAALERAEHVIDARDEALKQTRQSYEMKVQDFAAETLRASTLVFVVKRLYETLEAAVWGTGRKISGSCS